MCSVLCKIVILQLSLLVLCGSAEWLPCVNSSTAGPSSVSSEEQASVKGMTSDGADVEETGFCIPCNKGHCQCGKVPNRILQCSNEHLSVLDCYCVTYNADQDLVEVGSCLQNCDVSKKNSSADMVYHPLPTNLSEWSEFMCGSRFNRKGTLCGSCKEDYHSRVYSFNMSCVSCAGGPRNWWKFALVPFLPLTVFYLLVLVLHINATSSHLLGFVFYCQAVTMSPFMRFMTLESTHYPILFVPMMLIATLYGIWNLDFLRSLDLGICLGTDTLLSLALQLVVCVYPLLLMLLSYCLIVLYSRDCRLVVMVWRPFGAVFGAFSQNWDIRTSLVDSFATFFLLSHMQFLNVASDLLTPVQVFQISLSSQQLTHSWRLFYDADVVYFGKQHLPYAVLAIVGGAFFVLLPVTILLLYPFRCFQRVLQVFPGRWYVLHTFVDSFLGCYKDGTTPSSRDCRWFSLVFFSARFCGALIAVFIPSSTAVTLIPMICSATVVSIIHLEPFKDAVHRYGENSAVFILLLGTLCVAGSGKDLASLRDQGMILPFVALECLSLVAPLVYISAIILYWLFRHRFGLQLIQRVCARRRGYQTL